MKNEISAIVESGGKQYRVAPGQSIDVEKLPASEGETVELNRVLMVAQGDKVTLGSPLVKGAQVLATVAANEKEDKVIVFHYKNKVRYRRKRGHRQPFTRLSIGEIKTR